jgi:hypothetical protein
MYIYVIFYEVTVGFLYGIFTYVYLCMHVCSVSRNKELKGRHGIFIYVYLCMHVYSVPLYMYVFVLTRIYTVCVCMNVYS